MKARKIFALFLVLCIAALLASCGGSAETPAASASTPAESTKASATEPVEVGPDINWIVSTTVNEANCAYLTATLDKIAAEYSGKFTYDLYPSSTMIQINEIAQALNNNTVQISLVPAPVLNSIFVYNGNIVGIPFLGLKDNYQGVELYNALYDEFPEFEEEWTKLGIKHWFAFCNTDYNFIWRDVEKYRVPSDFKGLKLQCTILPLSNLISSLGAAPVNQGASTLYENLEKSVVDGVVQNFATANGFGLSSLSKSATVLPGGISFEPMFYSISLKAWNALPAELQGLFEKYAVDGSNGECERQNKARDKFFADAGDSYVLNELTEEEANAWKEALEPFVQKQLQDFYDKGFKAVFDMYDFCIEWCKKANG
jgi:TRAP-type C4-dicarboxylate transport system substrate-binding protein